MAVSQVISVEEMKKLVCERKLTHRQISTMLIEQHPNVKCGLSAMSVRRYCKINGITRFCTLSRLEIHNKVVECASNVSFSIIRNSN